MRALRLLKLFDDANPQLTIAGVVKATGLNRTTAFRLLSALQEEGFLERRSDGAYALGAEALALGGYALRHSTLWQAAHPLLVALSAAVDERVTLELPSLGPDGVPAMLVVDEVTTSHRLGVRNFAGEHLPIHATSTGKAVMAFMAAERRADVLAHSFDPLTAQTLVDRAALSAELDTIRARGYATAIEELESGLIACAAPIFNMQGDVCGAISCVGPSVRIDAPRLTLLAEQLQQTARDISQRIGYRR